MIFDVKGIFEGITNSIFVKEEVEKIAAQRIAICERCPHYSPNAKARGEKFTRRDKHCRDCKCNMYLKTRSLAAECPLGTKDSNFPNEIQKWKKLVDTEEEANQLLNTPELKHQIEQYKHDMMHQKIDEHGNN